MHGIVKMYAMRTNCAPRLRIYSRSVMIGTMSLSGNKQTDIIDAFNTTSRYLDDTIYIHNIYFDNMVSKIYPAERQLNKANTSDTKI